MAAAKKSQPLTLEQLLEAQYKLLKDPTLTEGQQEQSREVIRRLEQIRDAMKLSNAESVKEDIDINRITRKKGDASHVSLGDVRDEVRGVKLAIANLNANADGDEPRPDRTPLVQITGGAEQTSSANEQGQESTEATASAHRRSRRQMAAEHEERLKKIGSAIEEKTATEKGGSRNETLNTRNSENFDRFIKETKDREEKFSDLNVDQRKLFGELQDTLIKLREAGSRDSKNLQGELKRISDEIDKTADTGSKQSLQNVARNAMQGASSGVRGDKGSIWDIGRVLAGRQSVLKEGFSYDQSGRGSVIRDAQGRFAGSEAKMGRLAGAATMLGRGLGEGVERYVESKRDPRWAAAISSFTNPADKKAGIGGRLWDAAQTFAQYKTPKEAPNLNMRPTSAGRMVRATGSPTLGNIAANVINIKAGKVTVSGPASTPPPPTGTPPPTLPELSGTRATPKEQGTPSAKPAGKEEDKGSGFGLGDLIDLIPSKWLSGAWNTAKTLGGRALSMPGVATAASAGVMYGAGRLVDWGAGKFGVGKDDKGEDLQLDTKADDANWNRMSWMEKAESGLARGIEKIGDFVAPNISRQAAATRIKNESEYFAKKDQPAVKQTETPTAVTNNKEIKSQTTTTTKRSDEDAAFYDMAYREYRSDGMSVKDAKEAAANDLKIRKQAQAAINSDSAQKPTAQVTPKEKTVEVEDNLTGKKYKSHDEINADVNSGKLDVGNANVMRKKLNLKQNAANSETDKAKPSAKATSRDEVFAENYLSGKKYKTMAQIDADVDSGKLDPTVAETLREELETKQNYAAQNNNESGAKISKLSAENADAKSQSAAPVVINNQSQAQAPRQDAQMLLPRGDMRPRENALDRYVNRVSHFF